MVGVYLLTPAESPHAMRSTYVGCTGDPVRRLLEHDRLRAGGAAATELHAPWQMMVFVDGFAIRSEALQFEYPWINTRRSLRTRLPLAPLRAREVAGLGAAGSVRRKLAELFAMLCMDPWRDMPLTLTFINQASLDYAHTVPGFFGLPAHMGIAVRDLVALDVNGWLGRRFVVFGGNTIRRATDYDDDYVVVEAGQVPPFAPARAPPRRLPSLRSLFRALFLG